MAATLSKVLAPRFKLQKVGASLRVPSKLGLNFGPLLENKYLTFRLRLKYINSP